MLQIVSGAEHEDGWIDVVDPTPAEIARLESDYAISQALVAHSLDFQERPRLYVDNQATLLVLKVPAVQPASRAGLAYVTLPLGVVLSGNWVATICPRENDVLAGVRRYAAGDWPLRRHHRLVLHTLQVTAEKYLELLAAMNRDIDAIEARLAGSLANREVLELLGYQKSLIYYATALRDCELMLERLQQSPTFHIPDEDKGLLADVLVETRQAIDVATTSGHILGEMMDAFASIISNNLARVMKLLAAVAVIFTVPVTVASFYGMNVDLPGQRHPLAFPGIILASIILSVVVALLFRRRDWL